MCVAYNKTLSSRNLPLVDEEFKVFAAKPAGSNAICAARGWIEMRPLECHQFLEFSQQCRPKVMKLMGHAAKNKTASQSWINLPEGSCCELNVWVEAGNFTFSAKILGFWELENLFVSFQQTVRKWIFPFLILFATPLLCKYKFICSENLYYTSLYFFFFLMNKWRSYYLFSAIYNCLWDLSPNVFSTILAYENFQEMVHTYANIPDSMIGVILFSLLEVSFLFSRTFAPPCWLIYQYQHI